MCRHPITLTLLDVNNGTSTNDVTVQMSLLVGDTNANGVVNASDVSQTKSQSGQAVNRFEFSHRCDSQWDDQRLRRRPGKITLWSRQSLKSFWNYKHAAAIRIRVWCPSNS